MLAGEYQPEPSPSPAGQLLRYLLYVRIGFLLLPWALFPGGLILIGLLALGPRKKDIPELWYCLPVGLALVGAYVALALWARRRLPPRIQRFAYDGDTLFYAVDTRQPVQGRPAREIIDVSQQSRRGQGMVGYCIHFRDGSSLMLSDRVTHAGELVRRLREAG